MGTRRSRWLLWTSSFTLSGPPLPVKIPPLEPTSWTGRPARSGFPAKCCGQDCLLRLQVGDPALFASVTSRAKDAKDATDAEAAPKRRRKVVHDEKKAATTVASPPHQHRGNNARAGILKQLWYELEPWCACPPAPPSALPLHHRVVRRIVARQPGDHPALLVCLHAHHPALARARVLVHPPPGGAPRARARGSAACGSSHEPRKDGERASTKTSSGACEGGNSREASSRRGALVKARQDNKQASKLHGAVGCGDAVRRIS